MVKNVFSTRNKDLRVKFKSSPVEVFYELYRDEPYAFLYESLELDGSFGRYSFIGSFPQIIFKAKKNMIYISTREKTEIRKGNPFLYLRKILNLNKNSFYFAPFSGGAVGYVSYDAIRYFEKIPAKNPDELKIPDVFFMFPEEIIIFDHKLKMASTIAYHTDRNRLKYISDVLNSNIEIRELIPRNNDIRFEVNFTPEKFYDAVNRAKDYIFAGDIFQVVLSQRFKTEISSSKFDLYRALRLTNPSPYMYYLKLDDLAVLGSSPEILIKLENGIAISRPLAGTRPRGRDKTTDRKLKMELLRDEKEL
ncbi:MAG: chorismate-binding protein, partial [candidate division WOR-3 bacterium]